MTALKNRLHGLVCGVWLAAGLSFSLAATAHAAIYDVPVGNVGAIRLNVPDSLTVVRGILMWGNGGVGDSRNLATDPELVALADQLGFAIVATSGIALGYETSVGDVASFEAAIAEGARVSGHPELVRAPLLPLGHSNGGDTSYDLNAARPEKVLATELSKASDCVPLPSLAALKTPAILIAGELDTPVRVFGIRARFFDNRPRGALWAWVEEQATDHTQVDGPEIAKPFAEMVARMRYPAGVSPLNGAVPLIALNEADGWLTDPNSYKTGLADIAPYGSYTKDKSVAGWLPNRRAAYIFRAFASYNKATATATINTTTRLVDPGAPLVYTLSEPVAPWSSIEYYEGDVLLKRVTPADAEALSVQFSTTTTGYVVLHALVTFTDGRQRTTMPRRALVRVPQPPDTSPKPETIIAWGAVGPQSTVPLLSGTQALATSFSHGLALKSDGTVSAWGDNSRGQTTVPAGLANVIAIAAGGSVSGALKSDGTVVLWGDNTYGQLNIPSGLAGVRQLAIGGSNVLALKTDGTVVEWGHRGTFRPMPANLNGVVAVASGSTDFSVALKSDGTVVAWDDNSREPPAGLKGVIALSVGISHALALKTDGTVIAWGFDGDGQTDVPGWLTGVVAIAASSWHSVALRNDGLVVPWGLSSEGISVPSAVRGARLIASGGGTNFALLGSQIALANQPQSQVVHAGDYVEFNAGAAGAGTYSYQWYKNDAPIFGATSATFALGGAQAGDSGVYNVTVFDGGSYAASAGATLAVGADAPGDNTPRLANLSTRAVVGMGGDILIPGIALSGSGKKKLIVRVSGPALAAAGVPGALARPQLRLFNGSNEMASNTGWSSGSGANTTALLAAFAQVGLPPFAAGSADCALLADVDPGVYTATISGVDNTTGVALVEVYELGVSPARLVAISCRARVGTGGDVLIPGITIAGSGVKKVIIRASGPALVAQGVGGVLAKPRLEVFDSAGAVVAANTGWSAATNRAELIAATAVSGLTPFPDGSADCAALVTLPTGNYTAKISGINETSGVALVEIYEVP